VHTQEAALRRLGELARDGDNAAAMVGACRGAATVGAALIESLRAAGLLPEPRGMRFVWDARAAAVVLLDLAEQLGAGDEYLDRLEQAPELRPALTFGGAP
jgi:hypothetical protein